MIKVVSALLGFYTISWLPFVIYEALIAACDPDIQSCDDYRYFRATSRLFYFSNVAVNVFIYAGRSGDFRMALTYDWYRVKTCCGLKPENRPRHPSATSSRYDARSGNAPPPTEQHATSTSQRCAGSSSSSRRQRDVNEHTINVHIRRAAAHDVTTAQCCCSDNVKSSSLTSIIIKDVAPDFATVSDQIALSTTGYCNSGYEAEADCCVHEQSFVTHL